MNRLWNFFPNEQWVHVWYHVCSEVLLRSESLLKKNKVMFTKIEWLYRKSRKSKRWKQKKLTHLADVSFWDDFCWWNFYPSTENKVGIIFISLAAVTFIIFVLFTAFDTAWLYSSHINCICFSDFLLWFVSIAFNLMKN